MEGRLKKTEDKEYQQRLEIAMKAFEAGCVIRSNDTGKWYTPREFLESNEKVIYTRKGLEDFRNFSTFYPASAIKSRLDALHNAEQEFHEFMTKIVHAFDFSPKKKLKKRNIQG
jgi:hypothetical protein